MRDVYITYGNLISSLGDTIEKTFSSLTQGESGVRHKVDSGILNDAWPLGYIEGLNGSNRFKTLFSQIINELKVGFQELILSDKTAIIVSSTKADICHLPDNPFQPALELINDTLQPANAPIFISNACISGVIAINTAGDLIRLGVYDNVCVIGIDVLSDFVINGFQSLFALSDEICKPYDKTRKGINLGEAGGAVILSAVPIQGHFNVKHLAGSTSNDANHISGPSRTGEGLVRTIAKTVKLAGIEKNKIDFISLHGTATQYNDEMESIAVDRLGMNTIPLNSLKGFFGHTLGAAGLVETIMAMKMMENDVLIKSNGYSIHGVSKNMQVITGNMDIPVSTILKTCSGFGGGNASLILSKNSDDD